MGFSPSELVEANLAGDVSYLLERNRILGQYGQGEIARTDICDAHPELIRAAHHYSELADGPCPVCDKETLRLVSYVFGPRLPSYGRCVNSAGDLKRIRRRKGTFTCYTVEVCSQCFWNHLQRAYIL
jgi:hypothetical protein